MNMPRSLLMPLSSSGHEKERLQGALAIAKFFGAHLDVLHAQVSPNRFFPDDRISLALPSDLLYQLEALAAKSASSESDKLKALFSELCDSENIPLLENEVVQGPSATWLDVSGLRSEMVAERGKVSDLLIIPQPRSGVPTATFESALMRSGKPVMLMPRAYSTFKAKTVALAWNGSTEVSRAITAAIPLFKRAEQVIVLTNSEGRNYKPDVQDLMLYFERHGISSVNLKFDSSHKNVGKAIVDICHENSYDLLVMGAYTHLRLQEQVFGGVTSYVVAHAKFPCLMMH